MNTIQCIVVNEHDCISLSFVCLNVKKSYVEHQLNVKIKFVLYWNEDINETKESKYTSCKFNLFYALLRPSLKPRNGLYSNTRLPWSTSNVE